MAEQKLKQVKEDLGDDDVNLVVPMSQSDFDRTAKAMGLIQQMGKTKGIFVKINDKDASI